MAMGKKRGLQGDMWIATGDLARGPGHPFYERLNRVLEQHGFDGFAEAQCQSFYAERMGRPSLPPGTYFRLLLIGFNALSMSWSACEPRAPGGLLTERKLTDLKRAGEQVAGRHQLAVETYFAANPEHTLARFILPWAKAAKIGNQVDPT
jgi:hypothetical protein